MAHDEPHHWIIDEANGPLSWGYCQVPGCEDSPKEFANATSTDSEWDNAARRARAVKEEDNASL